MVATKASGNTTRHLVEYYNYPFNSESEYQVYPRKVQAAKREVKKIFLLVPQTGG